MHIGISGCEHTAAECPVRSAKRTLVHIARVRAQYNGVPSTLRAVSVRILVCDFVGASRATPNGRGVC
jgi:hypothetical protein